MQRSSRQWLEALPLADMDVAEVSGKFGTRFAFRSYSRFRFPKHDICKGPYRDKDGEVAQFDLVLANQVWEHLDRPYAATRNVLEMLRPGGYFWVAGCRSTFPITAILSIVRAGARGGSRTC